MSKALAAVRREIEEGRIAPVYVVIGEEEWSRQKFIAALKKALVDPSMADFNFDQLSATAISGVDVIDRAEQLPMMADKRVVLVEDCVRWLQKDLEAITGYFDRINDKTCLVLLFETADRRRKIFQSKSKQVRFLEFPRPKRWELEGYIRELAGDMGLRLSADAALKVADLAGDDLALVHRELEKLGLFKLGSDRIDGDDVDRLMGRTRHVTRWELNEFIGKRDLHGALVKMHAILESGEDPISMLSTLNLCLKQLFVTKALLIHGVKDTGKIAQALGVPPRIAENLIRQQRAYSDCELRRSFKLLRDTDFRLKSSGMSRGLILDNFVCQVLSAGPLSPPRERRRTTR